MPDFVDSLDLDMDRVVVERNGQALTPEEARRTHLADGDRLEIVRIVAGGTEPWSTTSHSSVIARPPAASINAAVSLRPDSERATSATAAPAPAAESAGQTLRVTGSTVTNGRVRRT